jgi:hypothetical protein
MEAHKDVVWTVPLTNVAVDHVTQFCIIHVLKMNT